MAQLLAAPYSFFVDGNGAPLSGGFIYTYSAGTTTPKASYTDSGAGTPLSNPVVLDSAGRAQIWLVGSYKIVVKDSLGNTISTTDNIVSTTGAPFSDASALISNSSDPTKLIIISAASVTTGSTRTYTGPDKDGTLALTNDLQYKFQDFRLTLTTALPVTITDVTGATTIYCTPYKGNTIALYDGSSTWNLRTSNEFSLALGTLTSGKPYDVFCYDNSGVPTLEFLVWTNDTTRATALVYQNGVLVKSGATTRRYMGSFYTTATTTTEDSLANRYLFNYYNRVRRPMQVLEATATWVYTTNTWRQTRASTANQLNYLAGVAEDNVAAKASSAASNSSASVFSGVSIGVDSTTTPSGVRGYIGQANNGVIMQGEGYYEGIPGVGRHFLAWLEISSATGTNTFSGNNSPVQTGIVGSVFG